MNKNLIDLQRNSKATCAIIKTEDATKFSHIVKMDARVSDEFLLKGDKPPFADKLDAKSKLNEICYFIITRIDEVSISDQERFVGLVKDREMNGYTLPDNCIIVFTVNDSEALKKVSKDLYHFAVVAF